MWAPQGLWDLRVPLGLWVPLVPSDRLDPPELTDLPGLPGPPGRRVFRVSKGCRGSVAMRVRPDRLVLSGPQAPLVRRAGRGRKVRKGPWGRLDRRDRRVRLARTESAVTRGCSRNLRTRR